MLFESNRKFSFSYLLCSTESCFYLLTNNCQFVIAESKKSDTSVTEFGPCQRRKTEKACGQKCVLIHCIAVVLDNYFWIDLYCETAETAFFHHIISCCWLFILTVFLQFRKLILIGAVLVSNFKILVVHFVC